MNAIRGAIATVKNNKEDIIESLYLTINRFKTFEKRINPIIDPNAKTNRRKTKFLFSKSKCVRP